MKNNKRLLVICFTLILCCVIQSGIYALELEVIAGMGNVAFDIESEEPLGDGKFKTPHSFVGSMAVSGEYSDIVDYRISLEWDPFMRSRMIGLLGLSFDYGKIELGPFAGLVNHPDQPFSGGAAGNVQLMYPGIVFINAKGASTFATPGEYSQIEGELGAGFWVPNVVCYLSVYRGHYNHLTENDLLIADKKIRYQFSADVHSKNVPYRIKVDMGYEELSRNYSLWKDDDAPSFTDEIKSFYVGFTGTFQIIQPLQLVLGMEMPVYLWAEEPLRKPDSKTMLYKAQAGVIWTVPDTFLNKKKTAPVKEETEETT